MSNVQVQTVRLETIKEVFNPRSDFSKVADIAVSIKSIGLIQPIAVRKDGSMFILVDGACRLRALKQLGIKEVPALIVDHDNAEEAQIAANLHRSDLNVLEKARGYERLIKIYPVRYNAATIAKAFGIAPKTVERLLAIVKRLPANANGILAPHLGEIGLDELEQLAQVPFEHIGEFLRSFAKKTEWDDFDNIFRRTFHQLDFASDALKTGELVSQGKAFVVKKSGREEHVYTADRKVYEEAKKAWEAKQKAKYGSVEMNSRKLSEKEKKDRSAKIKRDRAARANALKELPTELKRFLLQKPTESERDALAREICGHNLDFDGARRLAGVYGKKLSNNGWSIREAAWAGVMKELCPTTDSIVKMHSFLNGKGFKEQDWLASLKRKSKAK